MMKWRIVLVLVVCASLVVFAVQTLSQAGGSNQTAKPSDAERRRNMTDAERKREAKQWLRQEKLERERRQREFKKRAGEQRKQWELGAEEREKWLEEAPERAAERRREFLHEKRALAVTEEKWKVIKPKLEEVAKLQNLRYREGSTSGLSLGGSSTAGTNSKAKTSQSEPRFQWGRPWEGKAPVELSEGQKIAEQLIGLLEKKNAMPDEFKLKMDALRRARIAEEPENKKREKELSEAQQDLRKGLTIRQEATLVLMKRL
jgi:hypothetical protein